MALSTFLTRLHRTKIPLTLHPRQLSTASLLAPDSKTPLTAKQKSRAALTLLKTETNPDRIIAICSAASLTPTCHLDRLAFSQAISNLTKSHHYSAITNFLDANAEPLGNHAIVLFGQAGMVDQAIRVFKEMDGEKRSVRSLNALLIGCVLGGECKEAGRVFREFPKVYGIEPDVETYNLVVKAVCEEGKSESGYSVLAEMERNGVKPNLATFGRLIEGFYQEGKGDVEVEKVLSLMRDKYGLKENLGIRNVRIKELCKLKRVDEAKKLYEEFVKKRIKVNCATYGSLIHGFCKEGRFDEAKKLFKVMINSGCQPIHSIYFTLIYHLCQGRDFESALEFCKESMGKKWVPNFGTMKLLVNGLASSDKVDEAKELIKEMKEKFSNKAEQWDEIEAGLPQ